ncbi:carbohydrate binding family 9 domain-containing protein [candidate division KSB1 bacterium]|nr:carbohydrate binding family 9 domain-containing protein [candidate division KSB1 bacterium]
MQSYKIFIISFTIVICLFCFTPCKAEFNSGDSLQKIPHRVPKVNANAKIDAVLDEPFWNEALVVHANIEVRPGENIPAPVKTEALIVYNDNHIYAGFRCYDPEPEKIRAHFTDRDDIWSDDWILILFDTFNDSRRTYDFCCNPFGIQADMIESTSGGGGSWDAIWESHGRITEEGYVVEMAIPFSSLGFQRSAADQIWGFDVVRSYPRNVRHHIGAFPRDRNNNCYMCQAEKFIGFAGAKPGKDIEFDPTLSALSSSEREDDIHTPMVRKEQNLDPGITARWGFTPNLTLGTTINPDFSQVEADVQQLDINRQFAIYYPEKRPFFLEGADYFQTRITAVYTRTLADPRMGIKISGKEGPHTIGFFSVQDEITNLLFPGSEGYDNESLAKRNTGTVLRYKRDIGKSSNLGLLITDREGNQYYNRLGGVDGILKFTQKDQISFQALKSSTKYPEITSKDFEQPVNEFKSSAMDIFYVHDTRNFNVYSIYRQINPGFRADMGFLSQAGYRYNETGGTLKWQRDPGSWFTWIEWYVSYDLRRDFYYRPLHKAYTSRVNYEGPFQSNIGLYGEYGRDCYEGREYRANFLIFWSSFVPAGFLEFYIQGRAGDQIDYSNNRPGKVLQFIPEIEFKYGLHLNILLAQTYEHLNVAPGRLYTANISRLRLVYQFNKRTFLRTILQYCVYDRNVNLYYDEESPKEKNLFTQILFSYKINPQTVLFLGYSDNHYGDHIDPLTQTNRTFFAKIGYAWRI